MGARGKRTGMRNTPSKRTNRNKIKAKSKEVDGIKFRSLLEAFCYRKLKEAGISCDYEKHKYVLLEGFHYPNQCWEDNGKTGYKDKQSHKVRDITYTPDFVDPHQPKPRWIIECKGYANERFPLKWKMFRQKLMEEDDPPALFVPRNQSQCLETVKQILELIAPTK